jgi:hypothetical protein
LTEKFQKYDRIDQTKIEQKLVAEKTEKMEHRIQFKKALTLEFGNILNENNGELSMKKLNS